MPKKAMKRVAKHLPPRVHLKQPEVRALAEHMFKNLTVSGKLPLGSAPKLKVVFDKAVKEILPTDRQPGSLSTNVRKKIISSIAYRYHKKRDAVANHTAALPVVDTTYNSLKKSAVALADKLAQGHLGDITQVAPAASATVLADDPNEYQYKCTLGALSIHVKTPAAVVALVADLGLGHFVEDK